MILLVSCTTTKFVGNDEYLLDKIEIVSDNPDFKSGDLKPYVRQQPNFKLFGLVKWQLYVYNWSGKNANNWFNKQLRRIGEAPVLLDTMLVDQSTTELDRFLFNKGYINAEVNAAIDTTKPKKAKVTYYITSHDPYRIRNYKSELDDPKIDSIVHSVPSKRSGGIFRPVPEQNTSLIKEGNLFDRDVLDQERQRITSLLRRKGYYSFNRDNLGYLADTSFKKNVVDLEMQLYPFRRYQADGSIIDTLHQQYYIKDVTVLTEYNALNMDANTRFIPTDSVRANNIRILFGENGRSIRPGVLTKATYLAPGQLYDEQNVERTYSAFNSLRALKNVNVRFMEVEENDSLKLNAVILTSLTKPQSFGVDVEGTNSNGDFGFASSISYQHRNLFKGSEVFAARIRGAYESLSGIGLKNYWEFGGETSLTLPHFMFPFLSYDFKRRLRASTELKVSYNMQTRPEYKRSILSGGWSYIWQDRGNMLARHTFRLIDIDYIFLPRLDSAFVENLPPSMLIYNYSNQFIMSMGYTYSFNNYTPQTRMRNTHSLRAAVEVAGNLLYALSSLTNADKDKNGRYKLFGINYSQFVKGDLDLSRGIVLDNRNRLALHLGVGLAVPYGNAKMMPFERRYFSGGANSLRGWSVRSLGPGSMLKTKETNFATQVGEVRLDMNIEYRTKLFWKFELASYIDAGNIWTIRAYEDQVDGNFDFSRFYKEIAVSYGLGLRLDFDFFLLRLDTGFKAYNPQERGSKRWAITDFNFHKNFAWHFAVGYPF